MPTLLFPLQLEFKITTFANDFLAYNIKGESVGYIRQKMLKLVEEIEVFSDESKSTKLYDIKTDRWLDFNASYSFYSQSTFIGNLARKGWTSIWSAKYETYDENGNLIFRIQEDNPFVKILDGLVGQIPIINIFVGYFFNPSYSAFDAQGNFIARLSKEPSFWGRKFKIVAVEDISEKIAEKVFLSYTMMVLLERRRG